MYVCMYVYIYMYLYIRLMNLHCMTSNQSDGIWVLLILVPPLPLLRLILGMWHANLQTFYSAKDLHIARSYMQTWFKFKPMSSLSLLAEIPLGPKGATCPTTPPHRLHHAAAAHCQPHPSPAPLRQHSSAPGLHRCVMLWCPAARMVPCCLASMMPCLCAANFQWEIGRSWPGGMVVADQAGMMCIYIYICVYASIYIYRYIYVNMYIYMCVSVYIYEWNIYIYIYNICEYMYIKTNLFVNIYMWVNIHIYMYMCLWIYIYICEYNISEYMNISMYI